MNVFYKIVINNVSYDTRLARYHPSAPSPAIGVWAVHCTHSRERAGERVMSLVS